MSGIGGETGGKLITVQAELPQDVDGILDAVRRIILLGSVQTITLKDGEPITYQRIVRPGETHAPDETSASFAELTPYEVVRNIQMEEFAEGVLAQNLRDLVIEMFLRMAHEGWVVTHILMGERTKFWRELKTLPGLSRRLPNFLGARIEYDKVLPDDVFILCGARTKHATIAEIKFALKGNVDGKGTAPEGD